MHGFYITYRYSVEGLSIQHICWHSTFELLDRILKWFVWVNSPPHKSRRMKKNVAQKILFLSENWIDSPFMRRVNTWEFSFEIMTIIQNDTPTCETHAWFKLQVLPFLLFQFWNCSYEFQKVQLWFAVKTFFYSSIFFPTWFTPTR